jgi:pimeloyl-ACP methyl ester carboxylesterase
VADPYMGFNLGSTKIRQSWEGDVVKFIFESPLVRLMKNEGYRDVYHDGAELESEVDPRSIWIYRYYEQASKDLGSGKRSEIEVYAKGLGELVARVRTLVCGGDAQAQKAFRVYLIAHSMGGLIARCYLQKVCANKPHHVDKVFTFATPHGGIDVKGIGNIPEFVNLNQLDTFSRERMRKYLMLGPKEDVRSLGGAFAPERFFSLVGTNHRDYAVAGGLARKAVGPMSDGLVRIENAYAQQTPRAFVHRTHSGAYGIVNSEEGYQNLRRFLFGDVRVDAALDVKSVSLPPAIQTLKDKGKKVRASYHIELVVRVRGARWDLHRRTVDEESAIFAAYDDLVDPNKVERLASVFLSTKAKVDPKRASLGFSIDLRVLVPEYEVDSVLFLKDHFDGGYLFRDKINLEATMGDAKTNPTLKYGFDSTTPNLAASVAPAQALGNAGAFRFEIPVVQNTKPGLDAVLRLDTSLWAG